MPQRRDVDGAPKIHHMFHQLGAAHKHSFTALTLAPRGAAATGCWSLSRRRGSGGGESESFAAVVAPRAQEWVHFYTVLSRAALGGSRLLLDAFP